MPSPGAMLLLRQPATGLRALTLAAGVGTDAERLAAVTGDGLALGSGFAVFAAVTNLLANSGGNVDTTGLTDNSSTTSAVASAASPFNGRAFRVVSSNLVANEGPSELITGGAGSTQYTVTGWAWLISGAATVRAVLNDTVGGKQGSAGVVLTAVPQKITVTATSGVAGLSVRAHMETTVQQAGTWEFCFQTQTGAISGPYVPDGGTRVVGRVQLPLFPRLFTPTQGWFAMRIVPRWAGADGLNHGLFEIADDGNNTVFVYKSSGNVWRLGRFAAAAGNYAAPAATHAAGDGVTLVCKWTNDTESVSVDGGAFTDAPNTNIPTLTTTTADLLRAPVNIGAAPLDGECRWIVMGRGTLGLAGSVLLNRLAVAGGVPTLAQLAMLPAAAKATCLVRCTDATAILLPAFFGG